MLPGLDVGADGGFHGGFNGGWDAVFADIPALEFFDEDSGRLSGRLHACPTECNEDRLVFILGCNQVFALSAGVDGNVNYSNYWCACVECRKHPLLISPLCLRRPSVGQRKTARFVFVARRRVSCEQAHFGEDGSSFCAAPQDATVNDHVRAVS